MSLTGLLLIHAIPFFQSVVALMLGHADLMNQKGERFLTSMKKK
jgi:hypothetical protein